MLQIKAKLLFNKRVKDNYFHLTLRAPEITKDASPGQFINIKVSGGTEPLLRRPFSIHRISGANIEILYEVCGEGTAILSQRKPGEYLDIIGSLGNGFSLKSPSHQVTKSPVLVAGGMGVAPLLFLAERLKGHQVLVLIANKTKSRILCEDEFKKLGCAVKISTDDGSRGFRGKVTELLKHLLSTIYACRTGRDSRLSTIYACGPRPMLKEISYISKKYKIPAQISLEEHMACGMGACLGCVVNTQDGYKRVCKDGPVFNAKEIIW